MITKNNNKGKFLMGLAEWVATSAKAAAKV